MFGRELKNISDMKNIYYMNNINDNYVNIISECYLLHDILDTSKIVKNNN